MFEVPSLWGTENQLTEASSNEIDICKTEAVFRSALPCYQDIFDLCIEIMNRDNLDQTQGAQQAIDLYLHLREEIVNML